VRAAVQRADRHGAQPGPGPDRHRVPGGLLEVALQGTLADVYLSETRGIAAAQAFLRSARSVTQVEPEQVTTDGHTSYPKAIAEELGKDVDHRTSQYKNNVLEQDHRGVKGRYRPMRGFKVFGAAHRFCGAFDEVRNFLRPATYINQKA
jgi:putative transposase